MRMFIDDAEVLAWSFTNDDGTPMDLTGATVKLDLVGPQDVHVGATVLAPRTDGKVEVQFPVGFFPVPGDYTGRWQITFPTGRISSFLGVVIRVYDNTIQSRLYANLLDLEGIVGTITDPELGLAKLETATDAVKRYILTPLDPAEEIPGPIRTATAILASRLYQTAISGTQGIASETIGDYRIAYQNQAGGTGLMISSDPVLANLLARWHPRIGNVYVGPDYDDTPLPVTGEAAWVTDTTITEEVTMPDNVLDLSPSVLDFVGVRSGDLNQRTFALNQEGAPLDLTNALVEAQARAKPFDPNPAITALITVIDAPNGRFMLSWPGDQVATVLGTEEEWTGVWDLQVTIIGQLPVTVLEGSIECVADVTR